MALSREDSAEDGFDFNDMSPQHPSNKPSDDGEQRRDSQGDGNAIDNSDIPKQKRIACVLCRKRKLRCDSRRPACSTCIRLQHDCSYDEVRKKSGPKRGYVKALEARLAQVETMLKTQDDPPTDSRKSASSAQNQRQDIGDRSGQQQQLQQQQTMGIMPDIDLNDFTLPVTANPADETFAWEMIGLGLDEPLPSQEVIDDLNRIYFEKIHPSFPMIHRARYYAAMDLAPASRPPPCLRYIMWANAAITSEKYEPLHEHFYSRARKYIQQDEMRGHGESMITLSHNQAWSLLSVYEFKMMYFPRAWLSTGRSCRMSQMMGLHRLDGNALDVKQCLSPPKDWADREERRRTFWMSYACNVFSSIGTGWPLAIVEADILTNLPGDDECFEFNKAPQKVTSLNDVLEASSVADLSSFACIVVICCLFGRNLTHLHRPSPDDRDNDLNGEFWKRHRQMDNTLLGVNLSLPDALRMPAGLNSPNAVFMNMCIHTSTICLHQAAIFKADKNRMVARVSAESKVRCITAAAEVAVIMRTISHLDLSAANPFISFCLYVASRVFVQYLKSRPTDGQVRASLQFLLTAMHAIKRRNPLTDSFLTQLDVDLESAGLENTRVLGNSAFPNKVTQPRCVAGRVYEHSGKGWPPYGNNGMAAYTDPGSSGVHVVPSNVGTSDPSDYNNQDMLDLGNLGFISNAASAPQSYELPNRQRSMDTSPDTSGDQHTPSSSTQHNISSQNSSHTGYSPGPQQQSNVFNPGTTDFTTDFNMHSYPNAQAEQQSGYVLPQDWASGLTSGVSTGSMSTGLTPSQSTGMTPLASDMLGMSDAEWSQMMDGFLQAEKS